MTYVFDPILGAGRDDKVTLPAMQTAFDTGTVSQTAAFRSSVSGAGKVAPPQIAPDDYAIIPTSVRTLALPNVYPGQSAHVVHPSLVVTPMFGGYRYWLAFTPYPDTQSRYENPCVVASNDLLNWAQPAANPLVPQPAPVGGTNYNADTHLFMSADGATMYLAFREREGVGGENRLKIMQTGDGLTWTAPVTILSGAVGTLDFGSPSIWWDGAGWTLISHNLDSASPWPVQRRISSTADIYGAWGAPSTVTIAPPAGRAWWHSSFGRLSSGQVVGLMQDNGGIGGSGGNLLWAVSGDNGATFSVTPMSFSGGNRYRSCWAVEGDDMHLMIGAGFTAIEYAKAQPGRLSMLATNRASVSGLLAGAAIPGCALWADTCIRANSATAPGAATSGGSYTVSSGTWGISSNQLYPVASGRLLAAVGTPNHRVQVQFASVTAGVEQWMIGRAVGGLNYWRLGIQTPTASGIQVVNLQAVVAGAVTDYPSIARCQIGDYIGLDCSGTRIQVLINGQPVYEIQSSLYATTGNSIGLQSNQGATTRYRNLVAVAN